MDTIIEQQKAKIRALEEEIGQLERLNAQRPSNYAWNRAELIKVAPYFKGSPTKFSLSRYIQTLTTRDLAQAKTELERLSQIKTSNEPRFQEPTMDLKQAVMMIFHVSSPNLMAYYGPEGFQVDAFKQDLTIWIAHVVTIWDCMDATYHDSDCTCCITFRKLATSWDDQIQLIMTKTDYEDKRVSKHEVLRWGAAISSTSAQEAFNSVAQIAQALISNKKHPRLSSETTDSSEMSDALSDEPGTSSVTPEQRIFEEEENLRIMQTDSDDEPETSQTVKKVIRRRKIKPRSISHVEELPAYGNDVTFMYADIGRTITVEVNPQDQIGRTGLIKYVKNYFLNLIKTRSVMATYDLMSADQQRRVFVKGIRVARKRKKDLPHYLAQIRSQYTTRSRKRRREELVRN